MVWFTYRQVSGIEKRLFDVQSIQQVAFPTDVGTRILKEAHRHRHTIEKDLPAGRALRSASYHVQQCLFAAPCKKKR